MARIYTNENFPLPAVVELRSLGHDMLTMLESGQAGVAMPDEQVLAFAVRDNRVLVTLNRRHFVRLHQQHPKHAGIVVCSLDGDFKRLAGAINRAILEVGDMQGKLLRVNLPPDAGGGGQ